MNDSAHTVIEQVLDELGLTGETREILCSNLAEVRTAYATQHSLRFPVTISSKGEKEKIRRFSAAARKLLSISRNILPDYSHAVEYTANRTWDETESHRSMEDLQRELAAFIQGSDIFLANYRPKKGVKSNVLLEDAVRALIWHIELATNIPATISRNKHSTGTPTLKSKSARAIGIFLRGIDPALTETAIANMIDNVKAGKFGTDHQQDLLDFVIATRTNNGAQKSSK